MIGWSWDVSWEEYCFSENSKNEISWHISMHHESSSRDGFTLIWWDRHKTYHEEDRYISCHELPWWWYPKDNIVGSYPNSNPNPNLKPWFVKISWESYGILVWLINGRLMEVSWDISGDELLLSHERFTSSLKRCQEFRLGGYLSKALTMERYDGQDSPTIIHVHFWCLRCRNPDLVDHVGSVMGVHYLFWVITVLYEGPRNKKRKQWIICPEPVDTLVGKG